jgi:hypothetical protein
MQYGALGSTRHPPLNGYALKKVFCPATCGTKSASKANSNHLLRYGRLCLAHIAKHLISQDCSCSEQTAKTSNPSLNSTNAPSKHSTHRKGTPPFSAFSGTALELVWSYGNEYLM